MKTPYYMIQEGLLRRNLSLIKSVAEQSGTEFILAFKAFALWKTFPIFREYISHTTASSPYEARLSYEEFGTRCHTYSPAYEEDTFPVILQCSSHITFNSISQYTRFMPMVIDWNTANPDNRISVGIRVNPEHSHIETDLYNPTAPGSRFGILEEELASALSDGTITLDSDSGISGFHVHCHCESSAEDLVDNLLYIEEKFGKYFPRLRWLNLGGGHLVTRKDYNLPLLVQTLQGLKSRYPNLDIILEPGSAFAWQTGPLVTKVVDIVQNHGISTAILDVSFTCHMPDCLEMPYKPAVREEVPVTEGDDTSGLYQYRLGGNSCLSGDFIEGFYFDHPLQIGDILHLEDMIHYTTVKTCMFNGIHHPSIVIQNLDGSIHLLREYHYEDYRDRMD